MKVTCMIGAMAVAIAAFGAFEREAPEKYWDLKELSKAPGYRVSPYRESDYAGMKALLVKGRGPKGSAAEFFCYYAVPDGKAPAGGWPGVVLVHGGGGTAFPQAVETWRRLGFAVIAQDWYNQRPAPALTNVPPSEVTVPRVPLEGGRRQDHVANVANMVLAHSLLRSFPEVNPDRTVFVGLSWGSWYGACVAAVDGRFKGVVEIYCGDKNVNRDPKNHMAFVNGRFLHAAKVPVWWAVSTNDQNVTPETSEAGFEECPTYDGCAIVVDLAHSHIGFTFESVQRMAMSYVGLGKRLPRLSDARIAGDEISARILDPGEGVKFAKLAYTVSEHPIEYKRKWVYADAEVRGDTVRAKLPANVRACYLAAYERETPRHDLCGTTKFAFPACRTVKLPGEPCTKPAVGCAPFPDRMSAYVWRNWFVVPHRRLADAVGAKEGDLEKIAAQMGLPRKADVLPEWRRKGYITVLRRNWNLLDYPQLMELVDMSREELRFSLMEDDFLFVKLGNMKPKCGVLKWKSGMAEEWKDARERIARILKEEGADDFTEEPRFKFVKDLSAPVKSNNRTIEQSNNSPFDFRLIFSYFADYCDPLWDDEIGSYPEGLLQKLSAQGVNAVWLHTVLRTLAKDPKYPEFGEGSERRIANLNRLVKRCAKYGIRVFLYMNEPRGMPDDFFRGHPEREAFRGCDSKDWPVFAMCTSCPEVRRWVRDSLEQVFRGVPGLGGIFTITMSENLTNCASRGNKKGCPRCRGRDSSEIVAEINAAMIEGMHAGNPDAEALLYDWQWRSTDGGREKVMSLLPKRNVRILSVSESQMPVERGGVRVKVSDYSISVVGPGEMARGTWKIAKANGLATAAKVQANCSWEMAAFPYLPVIDLVAEHAFNLAHAGVDGVLLSWSHGCCPAPNLSVFRDVRRTDRSKDEVLDRVAADLYGAQAVPAVRRAWTTFADGYREFPFSCSVMYKGPMHMGPANPLYSEATGCRATMVGIPYDDVGSWCSEYPPETWAKQMAKVRDGFEKGCGLFAQAIPLMSAERRAAAEKELRLFCAATLHFRSCVDQVGFCLARDAKDVAAMKSAAAKELATAKAMLPLVRGDSSFGYESSNQYFYIPQDVREKILTCRAALEAK